jgi:tetrahydromethanopterin S-methyltransferase subunit C
VTWAVVPMRAVEYLRCYFDAIAGSAIMAAAVIAVQANLPADMASYLRFVVAATVGAVVYALSMAIIARPTLKRMTALIAMRGAPGLS